MGYVDDLSGACWESLTSSKEMCTTYINTSIKGVTNAIPLERFVYQREAAIDYAARKKKHEEAVRNKLGIPPNVPAPPRP